MNTHINPTTPLVVHRTGNDNRVHVSLSFARTACRFQDQEKDVSAFGEQPPSVLSRRIPPVCHRCTCGTCYNQLEDYGELIQVI